MAKIIPYLKIGAGHRYPKEFEEKMMRIEKLFDSGQIDSRQRDDMVESATQDIEEYTGSDGRLRGSFIKNPGKIEAMGGRDLMMNVGGNKMTMGEKMYQDGTGQMTDSEIMRQEMLAQRRAERGMSPGQRSRMKTLESQEEMGYTPPSGAGYEGPLYKMPEIKEIVRSGTMEGIDLERLAATASRGRLPANLRGMIMQYLEEGPGAKPQQINQPAERSTTPMPTQFAFQEGPRGEGGTLTIRGRQSDIKKRTMGGLNKMYVR
tara:strand:- start:539 stop:1324 length:786 start_codon:yes stop_codon:yes gene_type:complete